MKKKVKDSISLSRPWKQGIRVDGIAIWWLTIVGVLCGTVSSKITSGNPINEPFNK